MVRTKKVQDFKPVNTKLQDWEQDHGPFIFAEIFRLFLELLWDNRNGLPNPLNALSCEQNFFLGRGHVFLMVFSINLNTQKKLKPLTWEKGMARLKRH